MATHDTTTTGASMYRRRPEPQTAVRSTHTTAQILTLLTTLAAVAALAITVNGFVVDGSDGWWIGVDLALLATAIAGCCAMTAVQAKIARRQMEHSVSQADRLVRRADAIASRAAEREERDAQQTRELHALLGQILTLLAGVQAGQEDLAGALARLAADELRHRRAEGHGAAGSRH